MRRESHRNRRVEEQLLRLLADLVRREVKDPRVGAVTFTAAEVSPDLSHATVYFLPFGMNRDVEAVAEALGSAAGFLRSQLGKQLNLRHVPQLHFKVDTTLEQAVNLSAKINEAVADDRRRHVDEPADAAAPVPPPATGS